MLKQLELGQAGVQVACVGGKLEAEAGLDHHVPLCDVGVLVLHPTPDSQVLTHSKISQRKPCP